MEICSTFDFEGKWVTFTYLLVDEYTRTHERPKDHVKVIYRYQYYNGAKRIRAVYLPTAENFELWVEYCYGGGAKKYATVLTDH